jgi:aspartate aminotransferase/aminotransferase
MTLEIGQLMRSITPAMSVKYNMRVYELQQQGKDVIVLSLGEAFFKMPPLDFSGISIEKGYHYSSSYGIPELRKKISAYYANAYGVVNDWEKELLISAGSKVIIYMSLLMLVNHGDDVMVLEPAWVSYEEQVRLCGAKPLMVPYTSGIDKLERHITPKTKVIIINNPNNPSGKIYTKEELRKLMEIAERHNLFVISDEAYSDFVPPEEPFHSIGLMDPEKKRTFIVNSLSKCMGLSGWRVGYVIAHRDYIEQLLKLNQHIVTCPTTLIELYLAKHFEAIIENARGQIKDVLQIRKWAAVTMRELGLNFLSGNGTFYFMVSLGNVRIGSEEFAKELLENHLVSTVPGAGYGKSVAPFLRVSVGTESKERMLKGFYAIRDLIQKYS